MLSVHTYNNRRIAVNALFLFLRSIITIGISLFASRILLQKLGVEDYGIYFVVGGIVAMFNSLRTFFSSSIQRFLNYAKGQGNDFLLNKIFNTGVEIQIALSLLLLLLMETVGLIAVNNLNIPAGMHETAHYVFQLSIFAAIVSMLTVPYDALIIANEKMNFFAFFSILESVFRLGIIYLIAIGPFNKLLNYAILAFCVSVIMRIINAAYCAKQFPESKQRWVYDKRLMKEMGSFAGWNFLGNTGFSLTHEGVNYVLNLTGGVMINAARALTYQIVSALTTMLGNIDVAFTPQINASVAEKDKTIFHNLLIYNAKASFSFYLLVMVPVVIFSRFFIQLWLGVIPTYVLSFIMAVSIYHLLRTIHVPIDSFFKSIGELKYYQIVEICSQMMNIPLAYMLLRYGLPYWSVFIGMSFVELLNHIGIVIVATKKYDFPLYIFVKNVYKPFVIVSAFSCGIVFFLYNYGLNETNNFFTIVVSGMIVEILLVITILYVVMDKRERCLAKESICKKIK